MPLTGKKSIYHHLCAPFRAIHARVPDALDASASEPILGHRLCDGIPVSRFRVESTETKPMLDRLPLMSVTAHTRPRVEADNGAAAAPFFPEVILLGDVRALIIERTRVRGKSRFFRT